MTCQRDVNERASDGDAGIEDGDGKWALSPRQRL